ncbi:MAG: 4-alpha-glucanotransferase [Bacteroidales bacterium]|nr:4-alpha-glucanotransferase [Bacteroidales bacterium]
MDKRCSGVLMHISSLPNKYGIGTFGREAYKFVDFLFESKQKVWQILPLGHTGFGDSPYQCYSAFAGNPLFIDIELLIEMGILVQVDLSTSISFSETEFDTQKVTQFKNPLFKKAVENFHALISSDAKEKYEEFCIKNKFWLDEYAFFMALKNHFNNKPWYEWPSEIKLRSKDALESLKNQLQTEIIQNKTIQFFFYTQWHALKNYANNKGISVFGDIPLYVAYDSADAWAHAELFKFDSKMNPIAVAGVPPDYFSETGQLWGNPLYDWEKHIGTHFQWWLARIESNFVLYDILRIDHFRGLVDYWSVPYEEKTAEKGTWIKAPGQLLFEAVFKKFGKVPIIAEDLGVITKDVEELRDGFGFPGMKILQFAFDSSENNNFLPHTYHSNCVVYTGTHDNDTTLGWYLKATDEDKEIMHRYFNFKPEHVSWELIRLAWSSVAFMAITPMQDLLNLNSDARMNLPGKPTGYWKWRMSEKDLNKELAHKLMSITKLYGRYQNSKS